MVIGERLKTLGEQKKLSQGDIEKRTGLLRVYISRVENGHTVPAIETLEKLARAMEIPMYQLFYDGENPPAAPKLPTGAAHYSTHWRTKWTAVPMGLSIGIERICMIAETQFTVEDFRKRIQAMTDEKLVQMGRAARYKADPRNSADKRTVRPVYVTQLQLCREEWARRHPKKSESAAQQGGGVIAAC